MSRWRSRGRYPESIQDTLQRMALSSRDVQDFWERYQATDWRRDPLVDRSELLRAWLTRETNAEEQAVTREREEAPAEEMRAIAYVSTPLRGNTLDELVLLDDADVQQARAPRPGDIRTRRIRLGVPTLLGGEEEQGGYGINYS